MGTTQLYAARHLLYPLVPLYRLALALREFRLRSGMEPVHRLRYPVVSIGNLSTGGSGKTPLTIALAQALTARGLQVDMLSRGYGRKSPLAARVDPDCRAETFGDEPLLIARETGLPVYVASQRYQAGLLAEKYLSMQSEGLSQMKGTGFSQMKGTGFSPYINENEQTRALAPEARTPALPPPFVHLLDDGFQHRQLARDVDILLLNRRDWQDSLLPAGNLREPLKAIRRAGVIAIPADDPELESELRTWGWLGPLWRLRRKMEIPPVNGPVAAFCGIAHPEQFFAGLEAAGCKLTLRRAFPDHFPYTRAVLEEMRTKARAAGATALITTEKDWVRLGKFTSVFSESLPLIAAHLQIEIEAQDTALDWLVNRLSLSPPHFTTVVD